MNKTKHLFFLSEIDKNCFQIMKEGNQFVGKLGNSSNVDQHCTLWNERNVFN